MKIIALTGLAKTGKDVIGDYLIHNEAFYSISFAEPIKDMLCTLLDCTREWLCHEDNKEYSVPGLNYSPRELMQTLGTEWGRQSLDINFWVDIVERKIHAQQEKPQPPAGIIITDCRFENESTMIRRLGGVICHIHRDKAEPVRAHISELGVKHHSSDFIIHNNSTIEDLYPKIAKLLNKYYLLSRLRRDYDG